MHHAILALALSLGCATAPEPAPEPTVRETAEPQPTPILAPAPPCERIVRLEAWKRRRLLVGHCERGRQVEMPMAIGRGDRAAKQRSGDQRTPEGDYRVSSRARPSRFYRFLPIDYPSSTDADEALTAGRISARDHRRILAAHARGEPPPSDTPLGGELGLHGEGARWRGESADLDWTYGCIALTDADLDFVIERVRVGTPVVIRP